MSTTMTTTTTADDESGTSRGRGEDVRQWVRICRAGAMTAVAWSLVLQLLIGSLVPPIAVTGVVFAVLAATMAPQRRWVVLLAGVLAAISVVANLPMTIDELSHPSSGVAFSLTLLITLAAIVTAVAGVLAFMGRSSRTATPVVAGAMVVLGVGVAVATVASLGVDSSQPLAGDVEVVAEANAFAPGTLEVAAGTTGFWLDNRDGIRHTLTVQETGQELEAPGYSAQRAEFDLEPGTWTLHCTVPGHESMRIALEVAG